MGHGGDLEEENVPLTRVDTTKKSVHTISQLLMGSD